MENTRTQIMELAEELIRRRGFNAFSYNDISGPLGIKNAAIHYHFPKKSDLAIAIIKAAHQRHEAAWQRKRNQNALKKLEVFFDVYKKSHEKGLVCLVGSMASEYHSFEPAVQAVLKIMVDHIGDTVTAILSEGKQNGEFHFSEEPQTQATLIITNLLAALQLERITGGGEYMMVSEAVLKGLKD